MRSPARDLPPGKGGARSTTRTFAKPGTHEGCPRWARGTPQRDCPPSHSQVPPMEDGAGPTLALPTDPLVRSPPAAGAVPMVTASGSGSRQFHCVRPGDVEAAPAVAWGTPGLTVAKWGSAPSSPQEHKAKGTSSCWMWGPRGSTVSPRTSQGPLRDPGRDPPRVRRIPPTSSGETARRAVTRPAPSHRVLQAG